MKTTTTISRAAYPLWYVQLMMSVLLLCGNAFKSSAQCTNYGAALPTVVTYTVCDLPISVGDTLFYSTSFGVVNDGTVEHMKVYDYELPKNMRGTLSLAIKGGKGGDAYVGCSGTGKYGDGGTAARVSGNVRVGLGGIPRGSTIRYVIGEAGNDSYDNSTGDVDDRGGSGGAASGILYRAPGETTWHLLMIAGAGGGGYAECTYYLNNEFPYYPIISILEENGGNAITSGFDPLTAGQGGGTFYWWHYGINNSFMNCNWSSMGLYNMPSIPGYSTISDNGNLCRTTSGGGGWGGPGYNPCNGCHGGMAGNVWQGGTLPVVYPATLTDCYPYSNVRVGGRGLCGGGACYSISPGLLDQIPVTWGPGCGGGGGATGGWGTVGANSGASPTSGRDAAAGGTSYISPLLTSPTLSLDASQEDGYGDFKFLPDDQTMNFTLSISTGQPAPFCSGTPLTLVGTISGGQFVIGGLSNKVFTWKVNGQTIGTGTNSDINFFTQVYDTNHYTFNTINYTYQAGDTITCLFSGNDPNQCGKPVSSTATYIVPADNPGASSQVQASANPGTTLCQAYFDYGLNKSMGIISFNATAQLIFNIGNSNPVAYQPYYRWYHNGATLGMHYGVVDTLAAVQQIYVADGDSVWCEVFSKHCSAHSKSNVIHISVSGQPSTGGTISGPLHPCPNSTVTYTITGALHAAYYNWVVTGNVTNVSTGNGTTRTFTIGTGNAHIVCYPQGACGGGDTVEFDVFPSNHITTPCATPPIVVSPPVHCAGQSVTLSVWADTTATPYADCYEWSTGANTRTITVTADGTYYVYLNGCKSDSVVLTGIVIPQPSIGITLTPNPSIDNVRNYWCRQDGHRFVNVTSSSNLGSFSNVNYQWFKNGIQIVVGININFPDHLDMDLNNPFYNSGDTIRCKATCTAACGSVVTWSNNVVLPVINNPAVTSITITPSNTTVCSGQIVSFTTSVTNAGTNPTYTWFTDGSFASFAWQYSVVFTNYTGVPQTHYVYANVNVTPNTITCHSGLPFTPSAPVTITVLPQPSVVATAANVSGCAGSLITLSGTPAGGIFSKPNPYLGPSTSYIYSFIDANGCASTSAPATISVTNMPGITATVSPNDTVCAGIDVTFTASGASSYSWTGGPTNGDPFTIYDTDTFNVTGYGATGCSGDRIFIKISAGFTHTLGIKSDGSLWAWGANTSGQLGNGTNLSSNIPVRVGTANDWVDISAGEYHSLAIKSNGTLWAWGRNVYGTLGDGTNTDRNVPVQITTHTDWIGVAAGGEFSIGIKSNGHIWGWGYNGNGEVGTYFSNNPNVPLQINNDNNWISISAGLDHTLALKSNGTLWAWGNNANGALGTGNFSTVVGPIQVGLASNWVSIAAGGLHSMAIKSDGTLWAWGFNFDGELGDGTTTNRNIPVQVGTGNNWVNVSGGWYHSMGLQTDGSLWAWGNNSYGQLASGTFTLPVLTPAQVGNETGWASISAGGYHSFGIQLYGTSFAWGRNSSGQLGDASNTDQNVMVMPVNPPYSTSIIVTVKQAPALSITASPTDTVCAGAQVTLTATGANSYSWTGGVTNGVAFTPAETDTFFVTGTGANGCTTTLAHLIKVNTIETWYLDADNDGYYVSSLVNCGYPGIGYNLSATIAGDCNDNNAGIHDAPSPTITGTLSFCSGSSTTLDLGSGYNSYSWSNGATTQTINVNTAGSWSGTVTMNGCSGTSAAAVTTVNSLPSVSFTGLAAAYGVSSSPVTLAGTPPGGTFSGPGISGNAFSPSVAGIGGPYTITYSYTNANGCSNSTTHQTTVINCVVTAKPGTINTVGGAVSVCPGMTVTYTIPVTTGATSYTWTPPTGVVIISGQGTRQLTVNYTASFIVSGTLSVVANNACGSSLPRTVAITRNTPVLPGIITGIAYGVCNSNSVPYSVVNVAGMTYNWSFNVGTASVASGQGTNAITANFTSSYALGTLSVTAGNGCGTSPVRSLSVAAIPAQPGPITGAISVCPNQFGVPYSIAPVASATTYTWTGPAGSHISNGVITSAGVVLNTTSTSVTVNFGPAAGKLNVRALNACGTGTNRALTIATTCRIETENSTFDVNVYPNPSSGDFILNIQNGGEENAIIHLFDATGKLLEDMVSTTSNSEVRISNLPFGVYSAVVTSGENRKVLKLIKVN